jgi:peptide/nickel transport system substrate-binding protein
MALRGSAALGVCGVAVTLALSACGGSSGSATSSNGHPAAASGGSLSVASSVAPPTMDLTSNPAAAIDEVLDYNVYQHLVQLAPNGDLVPVLATGWKISSDGLTYTFTLRQGVKFANGDPLTASDVVFSIKRVTAPNSQYPYAALFAGITGATAQGATTVVVTLSKPDNQLLYNMAANSDGVILDPASVGRPRTAPVRTSCPRSCPTTASPWPRTSCTGAVSPRFRRSPSATSPTPTRRSRR